MAVELPNDKGKYRAGHLVARRCLRKTVDDLARWADECCADHRSAGELRSMFPTTAVDQRLGIRRGDFCAVQLVENCLRQIDEIDPQVGAFADVSYDRALEQAARVTAEDRRPLAGIPIAIKANRDVAGTLTEHGSVALTGRRPEEDDPVVTRLRSAGAIIVGTTVCSEFSLLPSCEPALHGPVANPRWTGVGTGGSSGGAAAAVASGMVTLAHGNDAGGSLRIPANACGVTAVVGISNGSGTGEGVVAASLADALLGCGVLGTLPLETPHETFPDAAHFDAQQLSLGFRASFITTAPDGTRATNDEVATLASAAAILRDSGWSTSFAAASDGHEYIGRRFAAHAPLARARILRMIDLDSDPPLEPYTREFLDHAGRVPDVAHRRAREAAEDWVREFDAEHIDHDVLVSPIPLPPATGVLNGDFGIPRLAPLSSALIAFAWPFNTLGWYSIAVAGVQLSARPRDLLLLISAARTVEESKPTTAEAVR